MSTSSEVYVPLVSEGLSKEEIELAIASLRTGLHTMGAQVFEFERMFANYLGVKGAVMVNSGSSANLLAVESLVRETPKKTPRIPIGSMVAIPAVLWPTTLWPIVQLGLRPLLIDTEPNGLRIDLDEICRAKEKFKDDLRGVFVIHPLGMSINLTELKTLCDELNLVLIEDTCESLGAGTGQEYSGSVGELGTFSFYYSHHITTIEGGMVVSNNEVLLDNLRSMRAHGWIRNRVDQDIWKRQENDREGSFLFVSSGFNFRPLEIQGVLGKSQLLRFPEFLHKRISNAARVYDASCKSPLELIGYVPQSIKDEPIIGPVPHSWMTFPFRARDSKIKLKTIRDQFHKRGIATRPVLAGDFTKQPAFNSAEITSFGPLENSRRVSEQSFMIGNHQSYTDDQIQRICDALESTIGSI